MDIDLFQFWHSAISSGCSWELWHFIIDTKYHYSCEVLIRKCHNSHKRSQSPLTISIQAVCEYFLCCVKKGLELLPISEDFLKSGFHTCVSRTHNGARCLTMYGRQWSQSIPAFATKTCGLATKSHMLNFCGGLRGLCDDMLWLIYKNQLHKNKKDFLSSKKKQSQKQKNNNDFRKSLFLIKYQTRNLHGSKYKRPRNKLNDGCL